MVSLVNCEREPYEPIEPDVVVDTTANDATNTPSFTNDVKPIIDINCAVSGCHVTGAQFPPLTSYDELKNQSSRIKTRTGSGTMPPQGALSSENIETIAKWVDNGSPDN